MAEFFDWLHKVAERAARTQVGAKATAAGYTVVRTEGECLVWEKKLPDGRYLWVCDEENGLGVDGEPDMEYLVACYDEDSELISEDTVANFDEALEWCANAERVAR